MIDTLVQFFEFLKNIFLNGNFAVEHHGIAGQNSYNYDEGKADYSDCLITRLNTYYEGSLSYLFDKNAAKLANINLLIIRKYISTIV
ncbi:MAG: hypothetical protein NE328_06530 [Lentisphaeraceae bacterium]|nr:hypothetical protein [Lentisphaeraceae bacterium]